LLINDRVDEIGLREVDVGGIGSGMVYPDVKTTLVNGFDPSLDANGMLLHLMNVFQMARKHSEDENYTKVIPPLAGFGSGLLGKNGYIPKGSRK